MQKKSSLSKKSFITMLLLALFIGVSGIQSASAYYQDQEETVSFAQYKGEVLDSDSKKPLVFATLSIAESNISTITNTEGQFTLKVPEGADSGKVVVSFLGYKTRMIPLSNLSEGKNEILMDISVMELSGVDLSIPKDAKTLVQETLQKKGQNYFEDPTLMTAFYRETIKKRRKNVSLSEAVVNIYKTPYTSDRRDAVELYKARKSTDYSKLDTVALKLQGGPFNALFVDLMKYPEYIFTEETLDYYAFSFDRSTRVNDKLIFIVNFKQHEDIIEPLYRGKLYIDAENKILTSAIYSLNITDKEKASKLFVRKKPRNAKVWPSEVAYRVDYREKNGRWYYGYSNVLLEFKVNWDKKLFNSVYSMACEMAVTDWEKNMTSQLPKVRDRMKSSIILNDEALGFADPDFWGEYNIIEPEKSIESAIKKIQRQLRRSKNTGGTSAD
ncbi:carboxypeptidase-like regulatory domain-containing protein [Maribacter algarum]|uniref:Carboxypeptidase-like regulatory domain-containing protein n=1 Tax=Maribacter algarum (ex Zhang et al. 2020) TaxID=2578118 RepID=A0A5S3PGX5_9FLAO|nr:carboxypeptidase-like regulatory domain-containing protein [Maribacter algarum]TMM53357.1 carboxypeptidase-like regulatory domain-containing protein [Maribacter algarum]